jgi:hypothetical protein
MFTIATQAGHDRMPNAEDWLFARSQEGVNQVRRDASVDPSFQQRVSPNDYLPNLSS